MNYDIKAFSNNNEIVKDCRIEIKENEGLFAVYAKSNAGDMFLDGGCGVKITLKNLEFKQYMANYRHSPFWCSPFFGTAPADVPQNTQALIYKKDNDTFGVILPVVSEKYKCTLIGSEEGIQAALYSWSDSLINCDALAFIHAEGSNPFELMKNCAEYAISLLGNFTMPREKRSYPEMFEYLGWCSWDALMIKVNEEGLVEKCKEFKDKNIPVKWAIIDDMWADVKNLRNPVFNSRTEMFQIMHRSSLYSFKADSLRFPDGLKHCITEMKKYIPYVGMWHPTTGYWTGIDPQGEIAAELSDCLTASPCEDRLVADYHADKAYKYFSSFHKYLKECGSDFLKIDNQSSIELYYKGVAPVGEVARNLHTAIERSVKEHFDGILINCMGLASENMWNRPYSAISRCSDDFQPDDKPWFTKHIMQCSYNSLVQGQFNWGDWDMWWSYDGQGIKNSVLRSISGGPIYLSDEIGKSNRDVIMPLIFNDGRILRCNAPAMPLAECITSDPRVSDKAFTVWNHCAGSGVAASFCLNSEAENITGSISPEKLYLTAGKYAVYEHFTKKTYLLEEGEELNFTLANEDDYRLAVMTPVKNGIALIGLINKFMSPIAVINSAGNSFTLYEGGKLLIYCENIISKILVNDNEFPLSVNTGFITIDCGEYSENVKVEILF